jgi:(p)ppGpp synthase/HD superfamily hydrolase
VSAGDEADLSRITDSELVGRAFELAQEAHSGQEGKRDGSPYIRHPLTVARLLERSGADEAMLAAALLHDVVEDSDLSIGDVVERFGTDVGELVAALTEDDSIADYEERKGRHREQVEASGPRAVPIYIADKLANLRDVRDLYGEIGERVKERESAPDLETRVRLWRGDVEMAQRAAPELPLTAELERELATFEAERAGRRNDSTVHAR